jgi:hypothetical protein
VDFIAIVFSVGTMHGAATKKLQDECIFVTNKKKPVVIALEYKTLFLNTKNILPQSR